MVARVIYMMLNDNEKMEGSWKCESNKIKNNIG